MSLATLARKTRTKQRLRTRGKFILNMTGRGNVLGMSAKMSRGCNGFTNCAGKRVSCCAGVGEPDCCSFPHGGKPSKQMGYGVYLNRKSKGAYHPGGGPQCCTKPNATSGKIVWKQTPNISAGEITIQKRDKVLACNSDVYTAPVIKNCVCKNICGCRATDLLRYTRINKSFGCQTTKAVKQSRTASEQIARHRAAVDCIKPLHQTIHMTISVAGNLSFDGCCGNQCLIQGHQYTFSFNSNGGNAVLFTWCAGVTNSFTTTSGISTVSFTVPKFSSCCASPGQATIGVSNNSLPLDYCKKAFKKSVNKCGC